MLFFIPPSLKDGIKYCLVDKVRVPEQAIVSVKVLYLKWCQFEPDMMTVISYTVAQMRVYGFMERHQLSSSCATNHA